MDTAVDVEATPPLPAAVIPGVQGGCLWRLVGQAHAADTEGARRAVWVVLALCVFSTSGTLCVGRSADIAVAAASLVMGLVMLVSLCAVFTRRAVPGAAAAGVVAVVAACVGFCDVAMAKEGWGRLWPLWLPLGNASIILGLPAPVRYLLLAAAAVLLVLVQVETSAEFGLFDSPLLGDAAQGGARPPGWRAMLCAVFFTAVMIGDFALVSIVVHLAAGERERAAVAAQASCAVVDALAAYDLDAAEELLAAHAPQLTDELQIAYRALLGGLHSFRPYIPQSCFRYEEAEEHADTDADLPESRKEHMSGCSADTFAVGGACPLSPPRRPSGETLDAADTASLRSSRSKSSASPRSLAARSPRFPSVEIPTSPAMMPMSRTNSAHTTYISPKTRLLAASAAASKVSIHSPILEAPRNTLRAARCTLANLAFQPIPSRCVDLFGQGFDGPTTGSLTSYLHEAFLAAAVDAVNSHKGIVDHVIGERVCASFNTSRPCHSHAKMAVRVAKVFVERMTESLKADDADTYVHGAVASGSAYVGVLGTMWMRKHAIVGELPLLADSLERYAAAARVPLVCNFVTYVDASMDDAMRIMLNKAYFPRRIPERRDAPPDSPHPPDADPPAEAFPEAKDNVDAASASTVRRKVSLLLLKVDSTQVLTPRGSLSAPPEERSAAVVYEILLPGRERGSVASLETDHSGEWMYNLKESAGAIWEAYNDAGLEYHKKGFDAALPFLETAPPRHQGLFRKRLRNAVTIDLHPQVHRPRPPAGGSGQYDSPQSASRLRLSQLHVGLTHNWSLTSSDADGLDVEDADLVSPVRPASQP